MKKAFFIVVFLWVWVVRSGTGMQVSSAGRNSGKLFFLQASKLYQVKQAKASNFVAIPVLH
jgi:hypothetical protein